MRDSARITELDGLRGIAVLMVLGYHLWPDVLFFGWSGVDLFFVLSGYLITSILLRNRKPGALRSFYVRRILRIWPVYYVALLAAFALNLTAAQPVGARGLFMSVVFLQLTDLYLHPGVSQFVNPGYFAHSWSLAIEEQFYLIWPLLLLWLRPRFAALAAGAVAVIAASYWLKLQVSTSPYFLLLLATRLDGLVLGVVLAYLEQPVTAPDAPRVALRSRLWIYASAAAAGLGLLVTFQAYHRSVTAVPDYRLLALPVLASALLYFGIVGVAIALSGAASLAPLRNRVLCWTGGISFALYMYHPLIYVWLRRGLDALGGAPHWVLVALGTGLVFAAADLSRRVLEGPALKLKERFPYG
jgi:peptidoglycan/LPS O-acetylase OafA/YrhL